MKVRTKVVPGVVIIGAIITFILQICYANSALQTITGEGYLVYDCNVSSDTQRKNVIEQAKQDVIDKGGYYIRSYSKVDKNILSDDDLYIVSCEITNIQSVSVTKELDINGVEILHSVVQATVDSERLEKIKAQDINDFLSKYNTLNDKYKALRLKDSSLQAELNMYNHLNFPHAKQPNAHENISPGAKKNATQPSVAGDCAVNVSANCPRNAPAARLAAYPAPGTYLLRHPSWQRQSATWTH